MVYVIKGINSILQKKKNILIYVRKKHNEKIRTKVKVLIFYIEI